MPRFPRLVPKVPVMQANNSVIRRCKILFKMHHHIFWTPVFSARHWSSSEDPLRRLPHLQARRRCVSAVFRRLHPAQKA